jgi:hypothetical protein
LHPLIQIKLSLKVLICLTMLLMPAVLPASPAGGKIASSPIQKLILSIDKSEYQSDLNTITVQNEKQLAFRYSDPSSIALVKFYTNQEAIRSISLVPSGDYEIIDPVINVNNEYYTFKVKFKDLNKTAFLNFSFKIITSEENKPLVQIFNLFPYTTVTASIKAGPDDFFIGEEKIIDLLTDNPGNIRIENKWVESKGYDYMVSEKEGKLLLHVIPTSYGELEIKADLKTLKPDLLKDNKLIYEAQFKSVKFTVRESRTIFLNANIRDLTRDEITRKEGIEIQIDNHRNLQMHKTYRIENQEEAGGPLIAELFTKSRLSNGKVLCILRLFNYHRQSDGYLYIKDGDNVRFITNFSITPPMSIDAIYLLHTGGEWTTSLDILPGESVQVKIEGQELHKSKIYFKDVIQTETDTLINDERKKFFKLQIPINISSRNIEIFNFSQSTGRKLRVTEFREPKVFDFVSINYGEGDKIVSTLNKPILYGDVIQDVIISFNSENIDTEKKLYGEQQLTIKFKITSLNNQLIDQYEINNIVVCPEGKSPRAAYYNKSKCNIYEINLNKYLRQKTYDLKDWSRIEIEIEHTRGVYGTTGLNQRIEIICKRLYDFDIDVSFPAGLLIQQQGQSGYGSFGGISMAMIGQFSFFRPNKIASYRPYKIGVGFLAVNAFNFSNNANVNRDVGIVALGSIYPMGSKGKLTFPLYLGGGYFLSQKKWFTLLGPGIRINF